MGGLSARGRQERVRQAKEQARRALGREPTQGDFDSPAPRYVPTAEPAPVESHSKSEYVLLAREAAARLGISLDELEAMIAAGRVNTLPCGWTRAIPIAEVERLAKRQENGRDDD